ncbi:MAG: hypothetical protein ACRCSV_04310 [Chlamydiales bacterium]
MQSYLRITLILFLPITIYSKTIDVNTNVDGGMGNLREAIIDINNGSDSSNTINLQIFNNAPIVLQSDLLVIKKKHGYKFNWETTYRWTRAIPIICHYYG